MGSHHLRRDPAIPTWDPGWDCRDPAYIPPAILPGCQLYNSYNVSSKNLVLDQLIILKFIFFFILITYLHIFKFVLIVAVYYVLILCTISPQKLKQASQ